MKGKRSLSDREVRRAGLLILLLGGIMCGCRCNPVGPGSYKDPTKFTWTVDTIAYPGSFQTFVTSIWGTSPYNVYSAGANSNGVGMMFRFDGSFWSHVPVSELEGGPIAGAIDLSSVCGLASDNIWAGGYRIDSIEQSTGRFITSSLVIHWDGKRWSESPVNGTGIVQIAGQSPGNLWAAGNSNVLRYTGVNWEKADIPIPAQGMQFVSVAEVTPNSVYTVGFINDVTAPADTGSYFLYHFNGTSWNVVDSVIITSSYVSSSGFGEMLFAIRGKLYSSFGFGVQEYNGGEWVTVLNDTRVMYVGGNDVNNLYGLGSQGTAYWYNGEGWIKLQIPAGSEIALRGVWTDGNEVFITGYDSHRTFVYHGK